MRYMILLTHPKDFFECLQRDLWKPYKNRCGSFLWKKPSYNKVLNFFKGEINVLKNYFKWGGVGKVCERVVSSVSRARKEIGRRFPGRGRGYCIIKIRIAKERIIS